MTRPQPTLLTSFLFIDVTDVAGARAFFETALGLPVAEDRFRPPHHIHGLVKYDAGSTLLSLNKARPGLDRSASDFIRLSLRTNRRNWRDAARASSWIASVSGQTVTSIDNHVFDIEEAGSTEVTALEFTTAHPADSKRFFQTAFAMTLVEGCGVLIGRTRTMDWRWRPGEIDATQRRTGLFLTVLHCDDLAADVATLESRGVRFLTPPQTSQIGLTVRFACPDGHHFCLYQPSAESMTWESGPVLRRLTRVRGRMQA